MLDMSSPPSVSHGCILPERDVLPFREENNRNQICSLQSLYWQPHTETSSLSLSVQVLARHSLVDHSSKSAYRLIGWLVIVQLAVSLFCWLWRWRVDGGTDGVGEACHTSNRFEQCTSFGLTSSGVIALYMSHSLWSAQFWSCPE